jgi:hypothetical protein
VEFVLYLFITFNKSIKQYTTDKKWKAMAFNRTTLYKFTRITEEDENDIENIVKNTKE